LKEYEAEAKRILKKGRTKVSWGEADWMLASIPELIAEIRRLREQAND